MAKTSRQKKKSVKKSSRRRVTTKNLQVTETPRNTVGALTPEKRFEFLNALQEHANITRACEDLGLSRVSLYAYRSRDEEFAKEWDQAMKAGVGCLEDEAKRRAMGYEEAVYKNGVYIGKAKKYSDLLLLALLNAHWPEKYRPARGDVAPPLSPDDAKRITEARDVLKRLDTSELSTIATVMEQATQRAVARAVQPNGKRTLQ